MDCSPPGSSVHGIFQARILEWVAISFSIFFFFFFFLMSQFDCFLLPPTPRSFSWVLMFYIWSSAWGFFFFPVKTISGFVPKGTHRPLETSSRHLSSRVRHLLALDSKYPHSSRTYQTPSQLTQFDIRLTTQLSFLRLFFLDLSHKFFLLLLVGWLVGFVCLLFVSSI